MSSLPFRNKLKKNTSTDTSDKKMKSFRLSKKVKNPDISANKPDIKPGDLMVSQHSNTQNLTKKLRNKLKYVYFHHRVALMTISILFLAGGGYVVYRSFAATGGASEEQIYDYIKVHIDKYNGQLLLPGSPDESIRLPMIDGNDNYQNYVIYVNPHADRGNDAIDQSRRCYRPFTDKGRAQNESDENLLRSISALSVGESTDGALARMAANAIQLLMTAILRGDNKGMDDGKWQKCRGEEEDMFTPAISQVPAYKAAEATVYTNISSYGHPEEPEIDFDFLADVPFEPWHTCKKYYSSSESRDGCINQNPNYPAVLCQNLYSRQNDIEGCTNKDPRYPTHKTQVRPVAPVPVQLLPGESKLSFDNYRQQLIQVGLYNGVGRDFMKISCNSYENANECKTFIDQSCAYFKFCDRRSGGPIAVPGSPQPAPRDPTRGEDDGGWRLWRAGEPYYVNDRYPGRCVLQDGHGGYLVRGAPGGIEGSTDYDCNVLAQMLKCKAELGKLNIYDASTFANAVISPECGDQAYIRGAGNYVLKYNLNQTLPKGNLEGQSEDCTIQRGWAYSPNNTNVPLNVELYYDGPRGSGAMYNTVANTQRDDLKQFGNNGIHAFSFTIPNQYKDNKFHTVYMYANGIRVNGWPNGQNPFIAKVTFACDYPPTGNLESVDAKMINGALTCRVKGWAYDPSAGNAPIQVHAYIDGVPGNTAGSAIATANIYRADLQAAGQGNGKHGFLFDIPVQFRDANKHKLRVYALGISGYGASDKTNPQIGTRDFQCDQPPAGNLEEVGRKVIGLDLVCTAKGWAADKSNVLYNNNVALYFDLSPDAKTYSSVVVGYKANIDRPDVRAAGYGYLGKGNHGFEYKIPKQYWDGKTHTVHAYSLNIDNAGTYAARNNTFVGRKYFNCGQ